MKVTSHNTGARRRTDMPEIKMQGGLSRRGGAQEWGVNFLGRDEKGRTWSVDLSHEEAMDIIRAAGAGAQDMIDKALDDNSRDRHCGQCERQPGCPAYELGEGKFAAMCSQYAPKQMASATN